MGITSRAIEQHYEAEVSSYRAEIAQLRAENEALKAEVRRLGPTEERIGHAPARLCGKCGKTAQLSAFRGGFYCAYCNTLEP